MGRMERGGSEAFIGAERGAQGGGISLIPEGEVRWLRAAGSCSIPSGRGGRLGTTGWGPLGSCVRARGRGEWASDGTALRAREQAVGLNGRLGHLVCPWAETCFGPGGAWVIFFKKQTKQKLQQRKISKIFT